MNQNPEQKARDKIDTLLEKAGWAVQEKTTINFNVSAGIAVKEYQTEIGPADYVLFVDRKPCGVIEAKREEEGYRLTTHETQAEQYASSRLKWIADNTPLPFVYESTGLVTRFTDTRDPKPRSRPLFAFHKPETFQVWFRQGKSLRNRLQGIPILATQGLRECQIKAITQLEQSFKANRPRALIQMATGSGKTFTAITSIYRLLKFADAKKILFLVDTRNLGEQAEQEFMAYRPNDDNRKLGPGLLESVYEIVLAYELKKQGLSVQRQVPVSIEYDDLKFDEGFRADIFVEQKVILELKSVETITRAYRKQIQTYLRLSGCKLGYLLNFGEALMKDGIVRAVNNLEEE